LVQRLGRLNRDGKDNDARAIVWKLAPEDKRKHEGEERIGPYRKTALDQASSLLKTLAPLSEQKTAVKALAGLQAQMPEELANALAISPEPCPRALDVHGLFSTEPDLHGGFTDVSRFVRNADPDADLMVFWRDWQGDAPPTGDALDGPPLDPNIEACAVALWPLQECLKVIHARAWLWNDRAERWDPAPARDLKPGMTVMLRGDLGGYSQTLGWTGVASERLNDLPPPGRARALRDESPRPHPNSRSRSLWTSRSRQGASGLARRHTQGRPARSRGHGEVPESAVRGCPERRSRSCAGCG
jgi:CRISPR-associated endonuclease/helicase Cas3